MREIGPFHRSSRTPALGPNGILTIQLLAQRATSPREMTLTPDLLNALPDRHLGREPLFQRREQARESSPRLGSLNRDLSWD